MFAKYKKFEKYFFTEDKTKDMIAYVKLKHQFRSMLILMAAALIPSLYVMIKFGVFPVIGVSLLIGVLAGFKTKSYKTMRFVFFMLLAVTPLRHASASSVLITPIAIYMAGINVLVQTQSDYLTWIYIGIQIVGFYFTGLDRLSATIRKMTIDEIVESAQIGVLIAIVATAMTVLCIMMLYSHFTSLLIKVNALKDNVSKANKQLNAQNLMLQRNLEIKDIFIYTFSHELKNALNGLLGNVHLAYGAAKAPMAIRHLSLARVCGEILKNFIHNILDSGKLENGNLEVSRERKDVMSFMQNVWAICGRIIENKRLKGSLEIERNVPSFLELDEQRMIQIILNLVSNAVKFTEKGHVRIRVSWQTISATTKRESKENLCMSTSQRRTEEANEEGSETIRFGDMREFPDPLEARPSKKESHHLVTERPKKFIDGSQFYELNLVKSQWNHDEVLPSTLPEESKGILKIQVLDTGCGVTEEDQKMLFQKFSQVSSIQGQRKIGTGLGLWICKELATRLDGDIRARSIIEIGSVFELSIRTKVPPIPKKSHKSPLTLCTAEETNLFTRAVSEQRSSKALKILIADDDSFNIELMKNYLNKFGIHYFCAYDGEEAVSLFKKHYKEISFVITDNCMPKMTGTEAALEIASFLEEKGQPKIPILCISGDLKVHVGERGITNVIQKPINFDRLNEELLAVYPQLTQAPEEKS